MDDPFFDNDEIRNFAMSLGLADEIADSLTHESCLSSSCSDKNNYIPNSTCKRPTGVAPSRIIIPSHPGTQQRLSFLDPLRRKAIETTYYIFKEACQFQERRSIFAKLPQKISADIYTTKHFSGIASAIFIKSYMYHHDHTDHKTIRNSLMMAVYESIRNYNIVLLHGLSEDYDWQDHSGVIKYILDNVLIDKMTESARIYFHDVLFYKGFLYESVFHEFADSICHYIASSFFVKNDVVPLERVSVSFLRLYEKTQNNLYLTKAYDFINQANEIDKNTRKKFIVLLDNATVRPTSS